MQQRSLKLARYMKETYGQNNNIILVSPNSSFFLVAIWPLLKSGNVCVPLNPSTEDNNLSYIVRYLSIRNCIYRFFLKGSNGKSLNKFIMNFLITPNGRMIRIHQIF